MELISSLYTPALWVAFPFRDLEKSVELNSACLQRLQLAASRVFFSQECFFGMGLRRLSTHFDTAVLKDEQLYYLRGCQKTAPMYVSGGIRVLIASNHILNEVAGRHQSSDYSRLPPSHCEHLKKAWETYRGGIRAGRSGSYGTTEWYWYHTGDGDHFTAVRSPADLEGFQRDELWQVRIERLLESYEDDGWELATVGDLINALEGYPAPELPPLIEAGWNTERARGVYCWMGHHANEWEKDASILGYVSLARKRLVAAERHLQQVPDSMTRSRAAGFLDAAWRALLFGEASDPLGWEPLPSEVAFAFAAATATIRLVGRVCDLKLGTGCLSAFAATLGDVAGPSEPMMNPIELFGAEGRWGVHPWLAGSQLLEAEFRVRDRVAGIRFPLVGSELVYCPTASETEPIAISLSDFAPSVIYVPLANGLIRLGPEVFLVKLLEFVHVAAAVHCQGACVCFAVEGAPHGKRFTWRFVLLRTSLDGAVRFANEVNMCQ